MKYSLIIVVLLVCGIAGYFSLNEREADASPSTDKVFSKVRVHQVAEVIYAESLKLTGTALASESVELKAQATDLVSAIHFTEGTMVEKGTKLLTLAQQGERASVNSAQAVLQDAQADYTRIKKLAAKKAVSKAELEQARAALALAKTGIAEARVALKERIITAPFSGILGTRNVSVGTLLQPDTLITTLDAIQPIKIDLDIAERYLAFIKVGQSFTAQTDAYIDKKFQGNIAVVESRLDSMSRTIKARGVIENQDALLKPGMLLTVLVEASPGSLLAVPEEAIIPVAKKHYVYVVEERIVQRREVLIKRRFDGLVEIRDGLEVGEQIVVEGQLKIADGEEVDIVE